MSKAVGVIKSELEGLSVDGLDDFIQEYSSDERAGVKSIVKKAVKIKEDYYKEIQRTYDISAYEREYAQYEYICGIDEVGRGPLIGPVVAGAVILPKDCDILYINASKNLSEAKRIELDKIIREKAVAVGIGVESAEVIDEINILQATYSAMRKAINNLDVSPTLLLNDAVTIPNVNIKQVPIIKGDAKSISIGAASIVAKVYRDRIMEEYAKEHPGYGLEKNKGYGTKEHIEAIKKYGSLPWHRKSFIKNIG